MKLKTDKIILKKKLLGGYAAFYKEDKLHKFADNIKFIVYHGDMSTMIDKNIIIQPIIKEHLEVEYIEKANKLVIDTMC